MEALKVLNEMLLYHQCYRVTSRILFSEEHIFNYILQTTYYKTTVT